MGFEGSGYPGKVMKANILHVGVLALALLSGSSRGLAEGSRGWIGIELARGSYGGVAVKGVVPGSPAAMTDLAAGDEVLAIDDEPTRAPPELQRAVALRPVGRRLRLKVRGASGPLREVVLAPAARPSEVELTRQRLLGRPAPDFRLARVGDRGEGPSEALAGFRGAPLLIDFWATWCGPCVRALPHLADLRARFSARGLKIVGISTEEAPLLADAVRRLGIGHPVLRDGTESVHRAYGIGALPTLVLVDGSGVVRAVEVGGGLEAIEGAIERLLPARAP